VRKQALGWLLDVSASVDAASWNMLRGAG
jgi:hypothetical protein